MSKIIDKDRVEWGFKLYTLKRIIAVLMVLITLQVSFSSGLLNTVLAATDTDGNLAYNKTVKASAVNGSVPAARAVDGDFATRWASGISDGNVTNQWIQVDLGESKNFNKFYMKEYITGGKGIISFRFEYTDTVDGNGIGTNWVAVTENGNAASWTKVMNEAQTTKTFDTVTARYVRLYIITAQYLSLYELELYYDTSQGVPASSSWVYPNEDGTLQYRQDEMGNRIMDFSTAGYMGGGFPIPYIAATVTVNPSGGDDTTAIQNAINAVKAKPLVNGVRGAVVLGPGTFQVSSTLTINASGIVIRGSGSNSSGTVISMSSDSPFLLFNVAGTGSRSLSSTVNTDISGTYLPSGSDEINVSNASGFQVGDTIVITRTVTAEWVNYVGMDTLVRDGEPQTWIAPGTKIRTDRIIKAISGNTITLDAPVTDSFDSAYLGSPIGTITKYSFSGRISQVGLEEFLVLAPDVTTNYRIFYMNAVSDSWVRNIVTQNGRNCIEIDSLAKRITLNNIIMNKTIATTEAAPPAYFSCIGTQILIYKCQANGSGGWSFVTQSLGCGPIVFLNCSGNLNAGISPHQRWTTGILADGCTFPNSTSSTVGIAFSNRATSGSGQGWTTGWSVAWNVTTPYFVVTQAPGTLNWCIGAIGTMKSSNDPNGLYESIGKQVTPSSLYRAQLDERLGGRTADIVLDSLMPVNLASNLGTANYSASTIYGSSYTADKAFDDNVNTRWASVNNKTDAWIAVDFGANALYDIVRIDEKSYPGRITSYVLQSSNDGINYTDIPGTAGTYVRESRYIRFSPLVSRYFRVYINSATADPTINEIGVYNSSTVDQDPICTTDTPSISIDNNQATVSVKMVKNISENNVPVLIAALYKSNGTMETMNFTKAQLIQGVEGSVEVVCQLPVKRTGYKLKVFIWRDLNSMTSIIPITEFTNL